MLPDPQHRSRRRSARDALEGRPPGAGTAASRPPCISTPPRGCRACSGRAPGNRTHRRVARREPEAAAHVLLGLMASSRWGVAACHASGSVSSDPPVLGTDTPPHRACLPLDQARFVERFHRRPTAPPACISTSPPKSSPRGRAARIRRRSGERSGNATGDSRFVDLRSGRRCASRHLLQIDHVFPYALGGGAEPDNLRLPCAAHPRAAMPIQLRCEGRPRASGQPTTAMQESRPAVPWPAGLRRRWRAPAAGRCRSTRGTQRSSRRSRDRGRPGRC